MCLLTCERLDFMQILKLMSLIADAQAKGGVSICLGIRHFALVYSTLATRGLYIGINGNRNWWYRQLVAGHPTHQWVQTEKMQLTRGAQNNAGDSNCLLLQQCWAVTQFRSCNPKRWKMIMNLGLSLSSFSMTAKILNWWIFQQISRNIWMDGWMK